MTSVLVATLGAEPQVVTIATQLLLHQDELLQSVALLHTAPRREPIASALPAVAATFSEQDGWPPLVRVEVPVEDVLSPEQIDRFASVLFDRLKSYVKEGLRIHLLLAGGRKPMAMMGMSVARMVLGPEDAVWYLYSEESVRQAGQMLLSQMDQARLVPIPFPQFDAAPPVYTRAFEAETPGAALSALEDMRLRRLRHFVEVELTDAERELAALLATEVLTVEQTAERLHKSPKTVANQLNSIYSKLEAAFGLQPDRSVKREFLRRVLAPYFAN